VIGVISNTETGTEEKKSRQKLNVTDRARESQRLQPKDFDGSCKACKGYVKLRVTMTQGNE
jgi:hypothetical protein